MAQQSGRRSTVRQISLFFARIPVLGMTGTVLLCGCTANHYRESADKEAYGILKQKTPLVPNMETNFTIATNALMSLEGLPVMTNLDDSLGEAAQSELGAPILPLGKALDIAVKNGRAYQTQKESVYQSALNLTLIRHNYKPIFSSSPGVMYDGAVFREAQEGVDGAVGEHTLHEMSITGVSLNMDALFASGARLASDLTWSFTKFMLGNDPRGFLQVGASVTQPLLRGAGYRATMEALTQGERSVVYKMRDFVQYRRQYAVDTANAYLQVLVSRDRVRNSWQAFQAFKFLAARTRAQVREGKTKGSELRRLEQEEINNETSWISAVRTYRQALDTFKNRLGMSVDIKMVLDEQELRTLAMEHPDLKMEEAVRVALARRLDLYTQRDNVEDAARGIYVSKNNLLPDLDLVLGASVNTPAGTGLPKLDYDAVRWNAGLTTDLPLDRKSQRNDYRNALIAYDQAVRSLADKVDTIKLSIFDSWRGLDQAKRNYESSVLGVQLSEQRVIEQNMLVELGRTTAEEQTSAQNALTSSLNDRTRSLVDHYIARLRLWQNMGILTVRSDGMWEPMAKL